MTQRDVRALTMFRFNIINPVVSIISSSSNDDVDVIAYDHIVQILSQMSVDTRLSLVT